MNKVASFPIDIKHIQVIPFAVEMDRVLSLNDHKGGWGICSMHYLRSRLIEEVGEYFALQANHNQSKKQNQRELIDIANFVMMLWDREGWGEQLKSLKSEAIGLTGD